MMQNSNELELLISHTNREFIGVGEWLFMRFITKENEGRYGEIHNELLGLKSQVSNSARTGLRVLKNTRVEGSA